MKKYFIILFFISGCSLNELNGGYNTEISEKTIILPSEGIVVASTRNLTGNNLPLWFLVVKEGACNGFSAFGDRVGNPDVYKRDKGFVVSNIKKFPAGTYHIYNWSLFWGSLGSGSWQNSKDKYDLTFEVKSGEITYIGEITALPTGVKIENQMDRDLLVLKNKFPNISSFPKVQKIPEIKTNVPTNCK